MKNTLKSNRNHTLKYIILLTGLNINKSKPINHFIIGKIKNHALRSKLKQDNKQKLKEAREKKEAKKQKKKKKKLKEERS
jgi:replication initiation and membrane attachment protein DnaB